MKPLSRCKLAAAIGGLLLAGCVSTNAVRVGNGPIRPKVPISQILVYRTADQVPGKYEEVALINSKGDYRYTDEDKMINSACARKLEKWVQNAVILGDALSEPSAGAKVARAFFGGAERKRARNRRLGVFRLRLRRSRRRRRPGSGAV